MEDQMTPLSELGLTDPQQQQDELAAQLAIILHLLKAGGGGLSSLNQNTGPVVTQDMIDALSANAPERQGLVPPQTPAGVQTKPGVMTQLGAQISPRPSDAEFMVPQASGDLASLLSGGGESQVPGAITSYAGDVPTTYVPEKPQRPMAQPQTQLPTKANDLGLTDAELQSAIQGYTSRGEPVPEVLQSAVQGANAAISSTTPAPSQADAVKRATLAAKIKAANPKIPDKELEKLLDAQVPSTKATKETKPLSTSETSKMFYFNPKTNSIEPFSALGEEATQAKAKELGARMLGATELTGLSALRAIEPAFKDFQAAAEALSKIPATRRSAAGLVGGTNPLNTRAFIAADKLTDGAWSQYHSARLELSAILAHVYGLGTRGASSPQLETMISSGLGTILDQPGKLADRFSSLQKRINGLKKAAVQGAFGTTHMPAPTQLFAPDQGRSNRLEAAKELIRQGIDLNSEVGVQ